MISSARILLFLILVGSVLEGGPECFADVYARALAGPSYQNQGLGRELVYGIDAGYSVPHWDFGLYTTYQTTTRLSGTSAANMGFLNFDQRMLLIAAEINYFVTAVREGLYFGMKLGVGTTMTSSTLIGQSPTDSVSSRLAYGLAVGYQFRLSPSLSLSPEVNYLVVGGNGYRSLNALGALKWHF